MSHHRPFGEFTPLSENAPNHTKQPNAGNNSTAPPGSGSGSGGSGGAPPNMSRRESFTPAFPSDAGFMAAAQQQHHTQQAAGVLHHPIPSRQPSAYGPGSGAASVSRRGSFATGAGPPEMSSLSRRSSVNHAGMRPDLSLSRRNSLAGGPRPITKAEYSGPNTPSILSRAGSPVLPLVNEHTISREPSRDGQFSLHKGELREGSFIGSLDCGTTSTRFIVFDSRAKIITEHQTEFQQILPHAGWHEQDPYDLVNAMRECMSKVVENLEWMGWKKESIKGIGITNQRETTLCWSRTTGHPLCNAIVWDDARTNGVVRDFERKLDEEGIDIDDEDEDVSLPPRKNGDMTKAELGVGTGKEEAAFGSNGVIEDAAAEAGASASGGAEAAMGKAMETLGLAGRGKPAASGTGRKRKGKEGLVDVTGIPLSTYFSAIKLRWMIDHHKEVHDAHESDDLMFGTVDTWLVYALTGAIEGGLHVMDVTNASRTLLISLKTLQWHPPLLRFFGLKASILPKIVSSSEVYGKIHANIETPLTGVPIAGIIGDQQAALVGNKCLSRGEAKNTYGTGSFVLFNTGSDLVRSENGLISTVAYQAGPDAKPVYALEGSIAVAGSAIKWLRDQMNLIEESADMEMLAGSVENTGGVYFVTAFSGLLAPYWDRDAAGTIIGLTAYSTSAHIARAVIEAVCYQTRAVLDVIEKESGVKSETLKVDGGVTNSDLAMQIQANIGGFKVARPSMRESTALGSALLAGSALGLFGWDLTKPETLSEVNTANVDIFEPEITEKKRLKMVKGWNRAVSRAKSWHTAESEDEFEEEFEKEEHAQKV